MGFFKNIVLLFIGIVAFVLTFGAFGKLTYFLSTPLTAPPHIQQLSIKDAFSKKESLNSVFSDMILAILFVLIHSFVNTSAVKSFLSKIGLEVAQRSIYNIISSLSLLVSV